MEIYVYNTPKSNWDISEKTGVIYTTFKYLVFCLTKIIDLNQMRAYFWVIRKLVLIQNQYEMRYIIDMIPSDVFYWGKVFLKLKLVLKLSNIIFHFENGLILQNFFVDAIDFYRVSIYKIKGPHENCVISLYLYWFVIKARKRLLIKQYSLQITFYKRQG